MPDLAPLLATPVDCRDSPSGFCGLTKLKAKLLATSAVLVVVVLSVATAIKRPDGPPIGKELVFAASASEQPKVAIFSTPGATQLCCGCPDPSDKKRCGCGLHIGSRTKEMGIAIKEGVEGACTDCKVDLYDISTEGGCPSYDIVQTYDAIIIGGPSWNGMPPPDIVAFMDEWPLSSTALRCKIGAGFSTGGGYYSGIQPVIEAIHRELMTFQMIIVGGPDWNVGEGAAAITGITPFNTKLGRGSYTPVNDLFLTDGRALGARIGNITKAMHSIPPLCGEYPGLVQAHRR